MRSLISQSRQVEIITPENNFAPPSRSIPCFHAIQTRLRNSSRFVINHIPTKGLSPPIVDHTLAMAARRRNGGLFAASAKPEGDCDEIVAPSMLKPLSDGIVLQAGPGECNGISTARRLHFEGCCIRQ
jgi:hypothetical protein